LKKIGSQRNVGALGGLDDVVENGGYARVKKFIILRKHGTGSCEEIENRSFAGVEKSTVVEQVRSYFFPL
jgi:hypothetical protein